MLHNINPADRTALDRLIQEINYHDYRYYVVDEPIIDDISYDELKARYQEFRKLYPELPESVGMRSGQAEVYHQHRMLSLRSVKSIEEVTATFVHYRGVILGEPKIDGLAVELVYRNHQLNEASTRGDGNIGESILHNVIHIDDIPEKIGDGSDIEVYGEIFISKADLAKINRELIAKRERPYDNARNAAAGIVRAKRNERRKYLTKLMFLPYKLEGALYETQTECYEWLKIEGFSVIEPSLAEDDRSIEEFWKKMLAARGTWPYDIDGVVFKIDSIGDQETLGANNHHPNWAIAIKFPPDEAETRLVDVVFQIGKSGIVSPVGIIDPVKVGGVTVTRVSLANIGKIKEKDIKIGDIVKLVRANDVIPFVREVVLEERVGKEEPIQFPTVCPVCHHKLEYSDPFIMCTNPDCAGQILGKLVNGVSRRGFKIMGLGPRRIAEMLDNRLIGNLADVFQLDTEPKISVMKTILRYGDKTVDNLLRSIEKSRKIELHRFIYALSIPNVSVAISGILAEHYQTLDKLLLISSEGVFSFDRISRDTLSTINKWFSEPSNLHLIRRLIEGGVEVLASEYSFRRADQSLIVITGSFSEPRDDVRARLLKAGYRVGSSLSKKTDFLLVGNKPGADKLAYAEANGIKRVDQTWLNNL